MPFTPFTKGDKAAPSKPGVAGKTADKKAAPGKKPLPPFMAKKAK